MQYRLANYCTTSQMFVSSSSAHTAAPRQTSGELGGIIVHCDVNPHNPAPCDAHTKCHWFWPWPLSALTCLPCSVLMLHAAFILLPKWQCLDHGFFVQPLSDCEDIFLQFSFMCWVLYHISFWEHDAALLTNKMGRENVIIYLLSSVIRRGKYSSSVSVVNFLEKQPF